MSVVTPLHTASDPVDGEITDTDPLTKKRLETVDEEFLTAALDFIDRQHKPARRSSSGSIPPGCTCLPT
jgi:hypothetical protein